jgi:hypothetical protein
VPPEPARAQNQDAVLTVSKAEESS